ncbi:MAG: FHA domain-containing protein [Deltaproteobacteria bacterium]|nr:FHA domain-containing protein [Deltaproteobacteria bacterium]
MDFPINQALLQEANRLKEERRVIRERLERVEANRAEVSTNVYARVRADYQRKLEEANAALLSKKGEIDKELATLYEARTKVRSQVTQYTEEIEELKFRKTLGEFSGKEFEDRSTQVSEKLAKFEALLAAVNGNIERYEKLFADEADLLPEGPRPLTQTPDEISLQEALDDVESVRTPTADAATRPPREKEDLHVDPARTTRRFQTADLDSDTDVGPGRHAQGGPVLALIEGKGEGTVFPLATETSIGRGSDNRITLKEAKVSRQHALIRKQDGEWFVIDLQSSNGVFLNGARVTEAELQLGDQLQIGDFLLEFRESE